MIPYVSMYVLAIIALCFTIYLVNRNFVFSNYNNKVYIYVAATTLVLLLAEIATIFMERSSNIALVIPHRIANIIGFSLCPLVPFILLLFTKNNIKFGFYIRVLGIPLYVNAFICIVSYKTGWVFLVDAQNQYSRGDLFLLPAIIGIIYYVFMLITIIKHCDKYEKKDKKVFISIFLVPLFGIITQILFRDILLIWGSTAISLLLYYIFLCELQFSYDIQTGVKNRTAFQKEMDSYDKGSKNAAIFVIDINNLKKINDVYGHKAGDQMILDAAKVINENFISIGKTYRIGGDEFCIICKEISKELAEKFLSSLDDLLIKVNENNQNKIVLAYGYSFYKKKESESIYSVFSRADNAMYIHKAKLKGLYGRRSTD